MPNIDWQSNLASFILKCIKIYVTHFSNYKNVLYKYTIFSRIYKFFWPLIHLLLPNTEYTNYNCIFVHDCYSLTELYVLQQSVFFSVQSRSWWCFRASTEPIQSLIMYHVVCYKKVTSFGRAAFSYYAVQSPFDI